MSERGDGQEPRLPRPRVRDSLDFSFSGLKSALVRRAEERGLYPPHPDHAPDAQKVANVAREFQEAIVDTMVRRTLEAVKRHSVRGVLLGGGVAANSLLRKEMVARCPVEVVVPRPALCTDNAAMIGAAGVLPPEAGRAIRLGRRRGAQPQPRLEELSARHTPHTLESGPGQHFAISWAICWLRVRIESSSQAGSLTTSLFKANTLCA